MYTLTLYKISILKSHPLITKIYVETFCLKQKQDSKTLIHAFQDSVTTSGNWLKLRTAGTRGSAST